jgi:predicted O-methyltransferase YrrM
MINSFPVVKPTVSPDPHGWFNKLNKEMLIDDVKKSTIIVELGSWLGLSTRWLCDNSKATVYAIDHWNGSIEHQNRGDVKDKLPTLYDTFIVNCWDYKDRIIPIRGNSLDGLIELREIKVIPDLIYIDASHEYEDVLNDLEYSHKLFPSAVIIGDDWNWRQKKLKRKTVQEAVMAFSKKYGVKVMNNGQAYKIIK